MLTQPLMQSSYGASSVPIAIPRASYGEKRKSRDDDDEHAIDDTDGLARYYLQVTSRDRTSSDAVRCAAHKYAA